MTTVTGVVEIPEDVDAAMATKLYADYTLDMVGINLRLRERPEFPRMKAGEIEKSELSEETLKLLELGRGTLERLDYWSRVAHALVERERNAKPTQPKL